MPKAFSLQRTALVLLAALLVLGSVQAKQANVTEIRIEDITTPINAGSSFVFSFYAGNMAGPPCSAEVNYWFEKEEERSLQGKDSFYLETGKGLSRDVSLLLPSGVSGIRAFFLEMKCNESTTMASRVIEIVALFPTVPQFEGLVVEEANEGKELAFSYVLKSSSEKKTAMVVEEKVEQDDKVVWTNAQNVVVEGSQGKKRFGPVLGEGTYRLTVSAIYGSETAAMTREFKVKAGAPTPAAFPLFPFAATAALLAVIGFGIAYYFNARRHYRPSRSLQGTVMAGEPVKAKKQKAEESAKIFESESAGVLDGFELSRILEGLGFNAEQKAEAEELAFRTGLKQTVGGFLIKKKEGDFDLETVVTVSLENGTNENWEKVVVAARVPNFLGKNIQAESGDSPFSFEVENGIARFSLEKAPAMQTTSFCYRVPLLVSPAEANSIPLPAVISLEEGEPLVIMQVKAQKEGKAEEKEAGQEMPAEEKAEKSLKESRAEKKGKESKENLG